MPVPKSVVRFKKNGVEFTSEVDRAQYLLKELARAALRDSGKYIVREAKKKIRRRTGRGAKNVQYWVRKRETDLQVGIKPGGFYLGFQELGTASIAKVGALTHATEENIQQIREIQAQYLSAIEDDLKAEGLISEEEYQDEDDPP